MRVAEFVGTCGAEFGPAMNLWFFVGGFLANQVRATLWNGDCNG